MLSNKPYLIRAFNEWIVDSRCTPLLVVDATLPRCNVPQEYVENGEIILNISPDAIRASFSGIAHLISVPVRAVLAIYAEENGQGMFFDVENEEETDWEDASIVQPVDSDAVMTSQEKRKPHLTLVE
jgi:stringent starvation protein B